MTTELVAEKASWTPNNRFIAARLMELASLLQAQGANAFRVKAYRQAAATIAGLEQEVPQILSEKGMDGLENLPHIGTSLARSIAQIANTGRLGYLQKLRGDMEIESLLTMIPAIGHELAHRLHEDLAIENFYDLERAVRSGKLGQFPGLGEKRLRAINDFITSRSVEPPRQEDNPPPVAQLLELDREYRRRVKADQLPKVAPQQNNPEGRRWLPIWHTEIPSGHYSVLFSNTKRAHELGMTGDWVVIYRDGPGTKGRWTVITAQFGPLRGRRIVRGRESECSSYYQDHNLKQS